MQQKELVFLLAQIIAMCTKHYLQTQNADTAYAYACDDNCGILQCEVEPVSGGRGSGENTPPAKDDIFVWSCKGLSNQSTFGGVISGLYHLGNGTLIIQNFNNQTFIQNSHDKEYNIIATWLSCIASCSYSEYSYTDSFHKTF